VKISWNICEGETTLKFLYILKLKKSGKFKSIQENSEKFRKILKKSKTLEEIKKF